MRPSPWISTWNQLSMEIRTFWKIQPRFAHPNVPIRLTEPCTGSTRVRPEWSFGWNHNQTTKLTVPELVFSDHLDILRTIVEPNLAWVVKNPRQTCILTRQPIRTVPRVSISLPPCTYLVWMNLDSSRRVILDQSARKTESWTPLLFTSQSLLFPRCVFPHFFMSFFDHKYYIYVVSFYE